MAASEGVDLEWAIVELSRVKFNRQKQFTRSYSDKIKRQAEWCVSHLIDKFKTYEIWHSDDSTGPFKSIYAKPEPKTDVVIKANNKIYTTSVKMEGPIQLASGQGASTAELFKAAAANTGNNQKSKVLMSIIKSLETMPTRLLSESNKTRIISEGKVNVINEFIKNGKIIQDKSYEYWLANNKPKLMEDMLKFIHEDKDFYFALIKEAMSGENTLANFSGAVANSIISPAGFHEINDAYVNKVIKQVKVDIRAKSRGGISSLAFRIETKGTVR